MTMITPSYLGETIEYSSLHACRSTLEDPTAAGRRDPRAGRRREHAPLEEERARRGELRALSRGAHRGRGGGALRGSPRRAPRADGGASRPVQRHDSWCVAASGQGHHPKTTRPAEEATSMTSRPTLSLSIDMAVRQAHGWVAAAIAQGERLLGLIKAQGEAGSTETWSAEQWAAFDKAHSLAWDHLTEEFEAYYFLCALRQVDRWLHHAESVDPALATAFRAFEKAVPHLKDIRDMREHEDEYLAGRGNAANRYKSSYNGLETTAHDIVVQGDDYLIGGGRVHVAQTIQALRVLLQTVEVVRRQVAPPKPLEFSVRVGVVSPDAKRGG